MPFRALLGLCLASFAFVLSPLVGIAPSTTIPVLIVFLAISLDLLRQLYRSVIKLLEPKEAVWRLELEARVAHIFHNCKRATIGLRETRTKKWLLDIEYQKRETFAYACEAYARVFERRTHFTERLALAEEYSRAVRISEERVDAGEVASIVRAAAAAPNGWKVILARCAPAASSGAERALRARWTDPRRIPIERSPRLPAFRSAYAS